jgi:GntR family transcriptional regulator
MPKLKKGPVPLYYQLERILRNRVLSKEIGPNELMPTEMMLCEEFGISRATVRQAFKALENDGLIMREQGRGTFVIPRDKSRQIMRLYGSADDLYLSGVDTELKLLTKKLITPDEGIRKEMNLAGKEKIYYFTGLRSLAGNDHRSYFQSWIPAPYGKVISLKDQLEAPYLIRKVEQIAGDITSRIRQNIKAAIADKDMSSMIKVDVGAPILVIKRVYFTREDNVLQMAVTSVPEPYEHETEMEMSIS